MPAGCEFICKNKECKCYDAGFIITDAWPVARIELIIEQNQVKKNESFRNQIIEMKNNGRKYFKIQYPNDKHIEKSGYSINKWCPKCLIVWDFDSTSEKNNDTLNNYLEKSPVADTCSKCNSKLMGFLDVIKEGIPCPSCQKMMTQSRWFTNEE